MLANEVDSSWSKEGGSYSTEVGMEDLLKILGINHVWKKDKIVVLSNGLSGVRMPVDSGH